MLKIGKKIKGVFIIQGFPCILSFLIFFIEKDKHFVHEPIILRFPIEFQVPQDGADPLLPLHHPSYAMAGISDTSFIGYYNEHYSKLIN